MHTHKHPVSGAIITGLKLGLGASLERSDRYVSSTGEWEECIAPGLIIEKGCVAVWVRPNAELSQEAKGLLVYLASRNLCLVDRSGWHALPFVYSKPDPRSGSDVKHPECVVELIKLGFVNRDRHYQNGYELTEQGRHYGAYLLQ